MNWYVDAIQRKLSAEDRALYDRIFAPQIVAQPHSDAFHAVCVMPDGEIRCYGQEPLGDLPHGEGIPVYLSSHDCGLTWKEHIYDPGCLGPAIRLPWSGRYIGIDRYTGTDVAGGKSYARISDRDLDDKEYRKVELPGAVGPYHPPVAIEKIRRIVFATEHHKHSVVFLSDDDGESWRAVEIPKTDRFQMTPPHQGPRWENSGVEPTVLEIENGRLMMILRTSTDYHYVTYSDDYGDTWTKAEPTSFHSTLTNPFLLRLTDGRILFFFNNTKPLPEQEKTRVFPPLSDDEKTGVWEDVFTNRDANCIAVSDDEAKHWFGFRELYLNPLRNSYDFRTVGGNASCVDKSVHQFQAIELPNHKVLVHVGQHSALTRLLIFDVNWLLERSRSENFRYGLGSVSTQVYLKSVSGGFRGFSGHCAWNRTNGAIPVPDPCGDHTEAVLLKNTNDDRLYSNAQGLVWNFPSAHKGSVSVKLKVLGAGLRVSLMDHWQNPIDLTVKDDAHFTAVITGDRTPGAFSDVVMQYDTDGGAAALRIDGQLVDTLCLKHDAPNGLCYLHLQTVSDKGDAKGSLVKQLEFHMD